MIRRNNKIVSAILAMTIISGLVTPVSATEMSSDNTADQVFSLENADLEKISDDTDILEEVSKSEIEIEDVNNNETSSEDVINNTQQNNGQTEDKKETNEGTSTLEESTEAKDEADVPLYDSIDEEMENYLREYLKSMNSGTSEEELEKLLQEYLEKMNSESAQEDKIELEDGIYSINNNALKMDSEEKSLLREYLSSQSSLEVKDGKISVVLTFDKNVNELDEYKILLNNTKAKIKIVESDNSILRIKFNINNFDEGIVLKSNVSNDYFSKEEECRIILDTGSVEKLEEEITNEDDDNIQDGTYTINNSTLKLDQNKESVLGNYLSNESILEVKDGQKYITLVFDKEVSAIEGFNIYVNNYISTYKIVESNEQILKVKFLIESIDDEIAVDANVTNEYYSENMKAQIILDQDSIKVIEKDDIELYELDYHDINETIDDGTYSVDYNIYKTGTQTNSSLADYVTESILEVKNGKNTVILKANNEKGMIEKLTAKVDGKEVEVKTSEQDGMITMKFEIENLKNAISIGMSINTGTFLGVMTHSADFKINDITKIEKTIDDGTYSVDYNIYKTGTQTNSSLADYVTESILEVKNGKNTVILKVNNEKGMIEKLTAKVDGKEAEVKTSEQDGMITMKFEIENLKNDISIGMSINTGTFLGVMTHSADFIINDIAERDPYIEDEEVSGESSALEDGEYIIGTNILKTGTTEESMAKGFFNEKSSLSVKNGKYYLAVHANSISMMSNIVVKVDGNTVESKIENNNDGKTGTIYFEIPRLNSAIVMYCHVDAGVHVADYDFTIALNKDDISTSTGDKVEPPVEVEKNTIYKVNNKLGANSGDSELAAYVDSSSIVEVDSNGSIYLTLNFTMSGLMNGRTIKLNNNESVTTYAVVNSNDTNGIRFKINSLSDKIHISNQYGSSVNDGFSLVLLEDTLEKTGTISNSGSGSGGSTTEDTSSEEEKEDEDDDDDIDDGTYVIKNYCYKEKSDTTSDARGYLDTESVLVVKNGKMYVILKFTHGKMMSDTSIKVENSKTSYTVEKKSGNKYYIKFKIDSLSDEIMVTTTIDTGVPAIGVMKGVKFRVLLRESTLKEDDDAADFDDEEEIEEEEIVDEEVKAEEPVQDGTIVIPPSSEIIDNNTAIEGYKKSTYKVNNEIVTDSQIGYQAARGAVNQTSVYEIKNEKKYITLGFSQTDILNNIRIANDGKNIAYTVVNEDKSKNTMNIRFEVPSLSTQLTVTANVTAMGRDISFGLKFLETTLELISTEESENITNNAGSGSNGSSSSSGILSGLSSTMSNLFSGGSSSEGGVEVSEEAVEDLASLAKEYFKKYTVNNEVLSDSAIGRTMARKYLSETSIIEEIDGQLYATITFSSASSMGNFRIDVNGETVSHSVPLKDMGSDLISLRFPISSVNDDIRTYIFISPMKMTIDFGIKFIEDTMTLIDEGTIGEEGADESSSLADTLSSLNQTSQNNKNQMSTVKVAASTSVMVIVLNQGIAGLGSLFRRFKNKSLLSKITNIE